MARRGTYTTQALWQRLKPAARALRRGQTDAETTLWKRLRGRRFRMVKFRRQHPVGRFIVDFCAPDAWLVSELDGASHRGRHDEDALRQAEIEAAGFVVLRFTNDSVDRDLSAVLHRIEDALA